MAEGALVGVAKGITEKAGNLLAQEIGLLWGVKDEIKKLGDTVSTISAVLLDAEEKQQHNNQVRVWLERLNDALYAADDLLDDISTEALRREVMTRNKKAKETLKLHNCPSITKLPSDFTKLVNLRLLEIDAMTHIPRGLEQMTGLQALSVFKIRSRSWFNSGLKELQGPNKLKLPKLKTMHIYNYGGKFPNWMPSLTTLVVFKLRDCNKCQHLPPLEQLPNLKYLSLDKLGSLEYMSETDYSEELSNSSFIPSLNKLYLFGCPNLKGWWRQRWDSSEEVDDDNNHLLPFFPRLSHLGIENCPKLTSMPLFPNVEGLTLDMCSLKPLKQTSTLQIEIANSSFAPLSKLEYLVTGTLKEPLPNLSNLVSLCCRGPPPQGMQHLTSLKTMAIADSTEVDLSKFWDAVEWQGLQSLQSLEIRWCSKLKSLPEGMGGLTSLSTLQIRYCHKLKSLPEGIKGLTSLNTLEIYDCPILLKRCKRETGVDWPKIAHIPNLEGI